MSAEYRSICSPSPVTSPDEWKILKWNEKSQQTNIFKRKALIDFNQRSSLKFFIDMAKTHQPHLEKIYLYNECLIVTFDIFFLIRCRLNAFPQGCLLLGTAVHVSNVAHGPPSLDHPDLSSSDGRLDYLFNKKTWLEREAFRKCGVGYLIDWLIGLFVCFKKSCSKISHAYVDVTIGIKRLNTVLPLFGASGSERGEDYFGRAIPAVIQSTAFAV